MSGDNHTKIKSATNIQHKEIESLIQPKKLITNLDVVHYCMLLSTHFRFLETLCLSDKNPNKLFSGFFLRKKYVLSEDLKSLKHQSKKVDLKADFSTNSYKLGWYYVGVGSQLGNQFIYKALNKHKVFSLWSADRYLQMDDRQSEVWESLIHLINGLSDIHYQEAETGAIEAFTYFKRIWKEQTREIPIPQFLKA